jgi:hypothetical protein
LVELINRDSSRTSSKPKRDQSSSNSLKKAVEASSSYRNDEARLDDIDLNIEEPKIHINPNNSFDDRESNNYYIDNINDEYIQKVLKDGETQGPSDDMGRNDDRGSQNSLPEGHLHLNKDFQNNQQTEKSLNRS